MPKTLLIVLSVILAIAGTVALYIFVLPKNKREKLPKFLQGVHDLLNFKELLLEKLLKLLYVFTTAYVLFLGFFMLFGIQVDSFYGGAHYVPTFGQGLLIMILGPIITRLIYETVMIAILLLKNVIEINHKLKGDATPVAEANVEAEAVKAPVAPAAEAEAAPNYKFCTKCGTRYDANKGGCPNCDK